MLRRILHFPHGIASYNNGLLELSERLKNENIELTVACNKDLSDFLEGRVARFVPLQDDIQRRASRQSELDRLGGNVFKALPAQFAIRYRHRRYSLCNIEISELIEDIKPDLLLIDIECHKIILLAQNHNVPIILLSRWFTIFRSRGIPPLHTSLFPAKNLKDKLRINWHWLMLLLHKYRLETSYLFSTRLARLITYDTSSRYELRMLARSMGLKLNGITQVGHWLIPHVYKDIEVMSLTLQELDFGSCHDHRMNHLGALVGTENARNLHYDSSLELLSRFLKSRQRIGNPTIYCSLSTYWVTGSSNTSPILELFSRRPDIDLILGLGGKTLPESIADVDVPDNVLILEYAPQIEVLKHADITISHGGISTINESLYHGVPLIICSGGHVDQNGCAARVAYHSVGLKCASNPIDQLEIEQAIDTLLSHEGRDIRQKVCEIQLKLQACNEKNTIVKFLKEKYARHVQAVSAEE